VYHDTGSQVEAAPDTLYRPASSPGTIDTGCIQRVRALNRFLHDVYHEQDILKAGKIP